MKERECTMKDAKSSKEELVQGKSPDKKNRDFAKIAQQQLILNERECIIQKNLKIYGMVLIY